MGSIKCVSFLLNMLHKIWPARNVEKIFSIGNQLYFYFTVDKICFLQTIEMINYSFNQLKILTLDHTKKSFSRESGLVALITTHDRTELIERLSLSNTHDKYNQ